jgi:hypothetical protein
MGPRGFLVRLRRRNGKRHAGGVELYRVLRAWVWDLPAELEPLVGLLRVCRRIPYLGGVDVRCQM